MDQEKGGDTIMAIFGVEGGIGSGKTITLSYFAVEDMKKGKKIYSNIYFKNVPKQFKDNIFYLTKDYITQIFEKVKNKEIDMTNSTVVIQEAHNYIDSRNSMSLKNKTSGYWILQSRL